MGNRWWIELETPDGGKAEMMELTPCGTGCKVAKDGFIVEMESEDKGIYRAVTVFVRATEGERDCFVSLKCRYDAGELYTFSGPKSGEETFRQSPHDPDDHVLDMAKEAVPMVALRDGEMCIRDRYGITTRNITSVRIRLRCWAFPQGDIWRPCRVHYINTQSSRIKSTQYPRGLTRWCSAIR